MLNCTVYKFIVHKWRGWVGWVFFSLFIFFLFFIFTFIFTIPTLYYIWVMIVILLFMLFTMYHRGIFLLRTLERQIILNWNFETFNIFLWWIKCWKSLFEKICYLSVMTVLSRASDDTFTYSFCVINFIGNYVKISL